MYKEKFKENFKENRLIAFDTDLDRIVGLYRTGMTEQDFSNRDCDFFREFNRDLIPVRDFVHEVMTASAQFEPNYARTLFTSIMNHIMELEDIYNENPRKFDELEKTRITSNLECLTDIQFKMGSKDSICGINEKYGPGKYIRQWIPDADFDSPTLKEEFFEAAWNNRDAFVARDKDFFMEISGPNAPYGEDEVFYGYHFVSLSLLLYKLGELKINLEKYGFPDGFKLRTQSSAAEPREYFPLRLVAAVYDLTNDIQFEKTSGRSFLDAINCIDGCKPLKIRNDEKERVCFLVNSLSKEIEDSKYRKEWLDSILTQLQIDKAYYRSKSRTAVGDTPSRRSARFAEDLAEAIKSSR